LHATSVKVHQAEDEFLADGVRYPAGTYILYSSQPYRSHLNDMMERHVRLEKVNIQDKWIPAITPQEIAGLRFQELRLALFYWQACSETASKRSTLAWFVSLPREKMMVVASQIPIPPFAVICDVVILDRNPFIETVLQENSDLAPPIKHETPGLLT